MCRKVIKMENQYKNQTITDDEADQLAELHELGIAEHGGRLSEYWKNKLQEGKKEFKNADFQGLNLNNKNLEDVHIINSNLAGINCSNANWRGAKIENCNLTGMRLKEVDLTNVSFKHSDLSGATFESVILYGANLERADLQEVDWSVPNAGIKSYFLNCIKFIPWSLKCLPYIRNCKWAKRFHLNNKLSFLSSCRVDRTRFSFRVQEPWHMMKRKYSGMMFLLILSLTAFSFLPYIFDALWWKASGVVTTENTKEANLLWLAIGGNSKCWFYTVPASIILITYNIARAAVTWRIIGLVHEESESQITPKVEAYRFTFYLEYYVLRYVFLFSFISFCWKLYELLSMNVRVPM